MVRSVTYSSWLVRLPLFAVGVVCLSWGPAWAQVPPFGSSLKRPKVENDRQVKEPNSKGEAAEPQPEEIFKVNTSLVNLDVLVTDAKSSRYITGLTKEDFVITEDEQPQTVASVTIGDDSARLPRSIVLIFDRSESQFPYLEASIEAAKELVNQLAPSDEMAIVTDDVELAIGFTSNRKQLKKTLETLKKLSLNGYRTHSRQFSALLATLRELIDVSRRRPIIIFQTDGDEAPRWDNQRPSSDYDMNSVYSEVEQSRTKIYTVIPSVRLIGIPPEELPGRLSLMVEKGKLARARHKDMWFGAERLPPQTGKGSTNNSLTKLLEGARNDSFKKLLEDARVRVMRVYIKGQTAAARVADLTGGWTSFLETPEQADEIYGRILADINHRYIISYYPTNKTLDGKLRKVRIEVRGHPDYVVQGRTSYFAMPR